MAISRYVKMVKTTYAEIDRDTAENKVNKVLDIIDRNGGKVVNITHNNMGVGLSTVYWTFVIVYEAENEIPASVFDDDKISGDATRKSRYIKMVKTTYNEIKKDISDVTINKVSEAITHSGGRVINITHDNMCVGMSTVYWVFVITYEAISELPLSCFASITNKE